MTICDVSVVIPAYNAESFVIDALESIERQSLLPKEVIIINDGSTDKTFDVVQAWIAAKDHGCPVHLFSQKNRGISITRNVGVGHATGQWIAFLDADDIWESNHLAELIAAIEAQPSAIAAYGAGRLLANGVLGDRLYDDFWDNPSRRFGKKIDGSHYLLIDESIFPRLLKGNFIKPSSLIFENASAVDVGLFNEDLGTSEDREFLLRLIRKGTFVYCPLPITQYRWHDDNATQTKNTKRNSENGLRVLKLVRENNKFKLNNSELLTCEDEIRNSIIEYLYVCSLSGWMSYTAGLKFVAKKFGSVSMFVAMRPAHLIHCLIR